MSAYVRCASLAACAAAGAVLASELPYPLHPGYEIEPNGSFESAQTIVLDLEKPYLSGKLQRHEFPGPHPDTYLGAFNKSEIRIAADDNSSPLGNGKASALFDLPVVPNGDDPRSTVRLWVAGRPDGFDTDFNGLFFNSPHNQRGGFSLTVDYFADEDHRGVPTGFLGSETVFAEFVTGAESFRFNFVPPVDADSVDVRIDNTVGTTPIARDVDHYRVEGLDPLCDYAVTMIGGVNLVDCRPTDAVLGWFDKHGDLIAADEDSGPTPLYPQLTVLSDASGVVRLAVSGRGDLNFNGLADFREDEAAKGTARNVENPIPEIPLVHGVVGCYTLAFERIEHDPDATPAIDPEDRQALEAGDLNLDGFVDIVDLARLLNNFGWTMP